MAGKRLHRLGLPKNLQERLARNGLTTCAEILNKSQLELMKLSGCCGLTVQDVYHKCCCAQAVSPITALELWQHRGKGCHYFPTSLPDLDKVLHGGILTGTITEIAGPAGCGKTQFSMTLSVLSTLPIEQEGLGGAVLYIDTEGHSLQKTNRDWRSRLPQHLAEDTAIKQLASQVHIVHVQSCQDLMNRLQNVEEDIICKQIKLMIVDSVASLVRKEYSNVQGGLMRQL